jgi:hypothetical protein
MRQTGWDRRESSGVVFGRRLTRYIETRSMRLFGAGASIKSGIVLTFFFLDLAKTASSRF